VIVALVGESRGWKSGDSVDIPRRCGLVKLWQHSFVLDRKENVVLYRSRITVLGPGVGDDFLLCRASLKVMVR
jgi:hypothetical protein